MMVRNLPKAPGDGARSGDGMPSARGFRVLVALAAALAACAAHHPDRRPAVHAVRPGETLSWIASGYGVEVGRLGRAREAEALLAARQDHAARSLAARAAFVTGSALAAYRESARAREAYARVRALDPTFEPPAGWLSPRLEALYSTAAD